MSQATGLVRVSKKGEARVQRGHPWVFRSDIVDAREVEPGAIVAVQAPQGRPLGYAFYSSLSEITLRMIARRETLASDWLERGLDAALDWRTRAAPAVEACRLVHGEGDLLPSIVVDRYADVLVLQTLSQAAERLKAEIARHLVARLAPRGILERNDLRVRGLEGLDTRVAVVHGEVPERVVVHDGDAVFEVDPWRGQKTGLFLDQRENHRMARGYARGRVLDGFCYDGGFALHVAPAASEVIAVDLSEDALVRVRRNAELSGASNVRTLNANVFDLLRSLSDAGEVFDTVVLDPPAFAKSRSAVEKAWRGYKEINLRALKLLAPGGCLITCSCSYHVHEQDFEAILTAAALDARTAVSLVEKRRQARDHPVLLAVPETSYLKCFVLRKVG